MEQHLRLADLSISTVQSYCRALRDAQAYIDARADEITSEEIMEFLIWRKSQIGSAALNTVVCGLKYYYGKVAVQQDKIVHIPTPRKPSQLGELLTSKELRQLITAGRLLKHRLVIQMLFGLGLRAGEISKIRLGDFNRKHRTTRGIFLKEFMASWHAGKLQPPPSAPTKKRTSNVGAAPASDKNGTSMQKLLSVGQTASSNTSDATPTRPPSPTTAF